MFTNSISVANPKPSNLTNVLLRLSWNLKTKTYYLLVKFSSLRLAFFYFSFRIQQRSRNERGGENELSAVRKSSFILDGFSSLSYFLFIHNLLPPLPFSWALMDPSGIYGATVLHCRFILSKDILHGRSSSIRRRGGREKNCSLQ